MSMITLEREQLLLDIMTRVTAESVKVSMVLEWLFRSL